MEAVARLHGSDHDKAMTIQYSTRTITKNGDGSRMTHGALTGGGISGDDGGDVLPLGGRGVGRGGGSR